VEQGLRLLFSPLLLVILSEAKDLCISRAAKAGNKLHKSSARKLRGLQDEKALAMIQLFLHAWVVGRIDVVEFHRRLAMDLNYGFAGSASVVVH
jgi:hypothetical protein